MPDTDRYFKFLLKSDPVALIHSETGRERIVHNAGGEAVSYRDSLTSGDADGTIAVGASRTFTGHGRLWAANAGAKVFITEQDVA